MFSVNWMEGPEEPLDGLGGRTGAEDHVWGNLAFQGPQLAFYRVQFAISLLFGARK